MTATNETRPEVTQAARDAAADMFLEDTGTPFSETDLRIERDYRSGKRDGWPDVQAFARLEAKVRTAAEAASRAREAELVEALRALADAADACDPRYEDLGNLVQDRVNDARALLARQAEGGASDA